MHLALALFLQRILPGTGKFYRNYTEQRFQKRAAVRRSTPAAFAKQRGTERNRALRNIATLEAEFSIWKWHATQ